MKVIKCNPTWAWAGSVLLEVVENGDIQQARDNAKAEIMKALRGYDGMLKKHTDYFDEVESEVQDDINCGACTVAIGAHTHDDGCRE